MKPRTVKELWWENNDLNIVDDDGVHMVYKDAYLSQYNMEMEPNDTMKVVEEVSFTFERINDYGTKL